MKNKQLNDRTKRLHRDAETQEKPRFYEKEVNSKKMTEEKFRNIGSANEGSGDQAEVEGQFRHRRDELRAKVRRHGRGSFQTRLKSTHRRAHIAELRRRGHPDIRNWAIRDPRFPIRSRHVRNQHRKHLWPAETSFHGMMLEKRHLLRRIRRLKRRLYDLNWQMGVVNGHAKAYRYRTSHPQGFHAKQRTLMRTC